MHANNYVADRPCLLEIITDSMEKLSESDCIEAAKLRTKERWVKDHVEQIRMAIARDYRATPESAGSPLEKFVVGNEVPDSVLQNVRDLYDMHFRPCRPSPEIWTEFLLHQYVCEDEIARTEAIHKALSKNPAATTYDYIVYTTGPHADPPTRGGSNYEDVTLPIPEEFLQRAASVDS